MSIRGKSRIFYGYCLGKPFLARSAGGGPNANHKSAQIGKFGISVQLKYKTCKTHLLPRIRAVCHKRYIVRRSRDLTLRAHPSQKRGYPVNTTYTKFPEIVLSQLPLSPTLPSICSTSHTSPVSAPPGTPPLTRCVAWTITPHSRLRHYHSQRSYLGNYTN